MKEIVNVLSFEKPAKVKVDASFDGGPPGGFVPQMSDEDARRWKAKRINEGKDDERIEIRKTINGSQVLIIVAKDGWTYKNETRSLPHGKWTREDGHGVGGLNVRISTNGPILMAWNDYYELTRAISEAGRILKIPSWDSIDQG